MPNFPPAHRSPRPKFFVSEEPPKCPRVASGSCRKGEERSQSLEKLRHGRYNLVAGNANLDMLETDALLA